MSVVRVIKDKNFTVMSNVHLRDKRLSYKAKGLMSVMLACPEEWDFSIAGLATLAPDGKDSVRSCIKELEGAGYLIRAGRSRDEKGHLKGNVYMLYESPNLNPEHGSEKKSTPPVEKKSQKPASAEPMPENFAETPFFSNNPSLDNPTQANPMQEKPTQLNTYQSNTYKSSTYFESYPIQSSETDSVCAAKNFAKPERQDRMDRMDYKAASRLVHSQIDIESLYLETNKQGLPLYSREQVDELAELITWVYSTPQPSLKINAVQVDTALVRERFEHLTEEHLSYVLDCLKENTSAIRQRRNYLLTCLYNAPSSIDGYYAAKAQHDMQHISVPCSASPDIEDYAAMANRF